MAVDSVRDAAIDVLLRVFERGAYLDAALDKTLRRKRLSERGRRFLTQLVYGTVRHRLLCDHALAPICHQPLEKLPAPIFAILRMAVFQSLFCNQVTHPAMVHTSVDLAKRRGHAGIARMVNAVLRRVPQRLEDVKLPNSDDDHAAYLSVRYSMPSWLVASWLAEHGRQETEALCEASATQAPTCLRVNTLKTHPDELVKRLQESGFVAAKQSAIPEEVTILEGPPPTRSKWFQRGHFILQDPASMLVAHLLEPQPGERVLDLCAAPGGKTTHLAQRAEGQAHIVAVDVHAHRLAAVLDNCDRLELPGVSVLCADATRPPFVTGFDRVLVDAPCSGLGTLRRHPDLKWRMTPEAVARLAVQQRALLRSAVGLCKNGGRIVYAVCTFSKQETQDVIQAILEDGHVEPDDGAECLDSWKTAPGQYRTRPSTEAWDGFFLTRFRKRS